MTAAADQPPETRGEDVVEVADSTQAPPKPAALEEPLLDRGTKFWLWMLGAAVGMAIAVVIIGLGVG